MFIRLVKRSFHCSEASLTLPLIKYDQDLIEPLTPRSRTKADTVGKRRGIRRKPG